MKGEIGVKLKDLENCREEKHPELIKNKTKPKTHTHSNSNFFFIFFFTKVIRVRVLFFLYFKILQNNKNSLVYLKM